MTTKNRTKNVLVIQARLNPDIIVTEQANFRKIIETTGFELTFANPLLNSEEMNWDNPSELLQKYGSSIWLGSAEVDLSLETPEQERYQNKVLPFAQKILSEDEPALGICLGHQTFALAGGAKIERDENKREFGTTILKLTKNGDEDPIFNSLLKPISMVFVHNDTVVNLPYGFTILGSTVRNRFSALRKGRTVTVQGHPEITDTTPLKKRILLAQNNTNLKIYDFTYPLVDPGPTSIIVKNFLAESSK